MKITDTGQDGNRDDRVPPVTEPSEMPCAHDWIEVCRFDELRQWNDARLRMTEMIHVAMVLIIWGGRFPDLDSRRHAVDVMLLLKTEADDVIRADARVRNPHD